MKTRHLTVSLAALLCLHAARAEMPGVWAEAESGLGHTASKPNPAASGGKAVSWFGQGKAVWFDLNLSAAMPQARVFLRYQLGAGAKGKLDPTALAVYLGPTTAKRYDAEGVRSCGTLKLANLTDWSRFGWTSLMVGDLPAGPHRLFLVNPAEGDAGSLDIVGLVPADQGRTWAPPATAVDGKLQGDGTFVSSVSQSPATVIPFAPGWQEAETGNKSVGNPQASGGKVASLWFSDTAPLAVNLEVKQDLTESLLYFRYARTARDHNLQPGPLDVAIGPVGAASLDAAGVRPLGRVILRPGSRTQPFAWECVNLGAIRAGRYRVFFSVPRDPAPVSASVNLIDVVGLLPATERGLLLPGNEVADGTLKGDPSRRPAVEVLAVKTPATGNLLIGTDYLGATAKPITVSLQLCNHVATAPLKVSITGELVTDQGSVGSIPAQASELAPGATAEVAYPVTAPGYGWYELKLQVAAAGDVTSSQASFGLLHPPAKGLRPESMFGLGMGSRPEDMEVAEAIGVKWRRGIPHTDPIDVLPKEGRWWDEAAIEKARQAIREAKDHGIMSLGYVNYNIPWNVRPDPLGRKIYQHQNRPQDLKLHTEMVYHLIKPLADEVKYWEVWNEPWVRGWTWRDGTAQDYRDMTRLIWDRVKPEMPDVMLIGGGSTPYMRDVVYAKGAENAGYIDGNSTHPYGIPDLNTPSITALEAEMNRRWSKSGGKGGIWATEVGTAEMMFDQLPAAERKFAVARSVAPIYLLNKLGAGDTPMRAFFFISNYGTSNFSGGDNNLWDGTSPKPGLVAYSAMTHFLEDAKLQGDLFAASRGAWALHFTKQDGSSVVALWTEKGLNGRLLLPAAGVEAYDYLGRPIGTREGERLELPLREGEVRYLVMRGSADEVRQRIVAAEWRDLPALGIYPRSFTSPLDGKPALRVKVENLLPYQADATLEITGSQGLHLQTARAELRALKAGETREVAFPLAGAEVRDLNRYPISYRARAGAIEQTGEQVLQVAAAAYGTPKIDGDLSDWQGVTPVTMVSRGGKDYRQVMLNPDLAKQLLSGSSSAGTALYRLWMRWDERNLYLAAEVPDATLTTNSTFEDDPYSFPFLADCLQLAFGCIDKNPDNLLRNHPLYEKSAGADVDYEFAATLARYTGAGPKFAAKPAWNGNWAAAPRVPQLQRLVAPGTNFQTFYPTNPPLTPPVGPLKEGQVAVVYDDAKQLFRYEIAIPWSCLPELGQRVCALRPGESLRTRFAWGVNDAGGRGRTFWQQEAGEVQPGGYGFSPHWGGGNRDFGGRILTDWGFYRDNK